MRKINKLGTIVLRENEIAFSPDNIWNVEFYLYSDEQLQGPHRHEGDVNCNIWRTKEDIRIGLAGKHERVVSLDGAIDGEVSGGEVVPRKKWPVSPELHKLLLAISSYLFSRNADEATTYKAVLECNAVLFTFSMEVRSRNYLEATLARKMREWWAEITNDRTTLDHPSYKFMQEPVRPKRPSGQRTKEPDVWNNQPDI